MGIEAQSDAHKDEAQEVDELKFEIPSSDLTALPEDVVALGNPRQMLANAELCGTVVDLLDSSNGAKREALLTWMHPAVLDLALSANGTRVIQKVLEVTGGETQINLSYCLHGRVRQLLDSH